MARHSGFTRREIGWRNRQSSAERDSRRWSFYHRRSSDRIRRRRSKRLSLCRERELLSDDGHPSTSWSRIHRTRPGRHSTVLMINETAAHRYWPGQNPVGSRLSFTTGRTQPTWLEIVGVVKDVLHDSLESPAKPAIYLPFLQSAQAFMVTVVRTDIDPASLASAVRGAMAAVDKDQPVLMTRTMADIYSDSVAQRRFNTALVVAFGTLALLLAVVGVYGLMAFAVTQRTHEMGVRIALGAERWDVVKLVLGQGLRLAFFGIAFGLAVAFFLTRFLSKLLFNVPQTDPATFILVPLCLGGIALLASYIPARRAIRVYPVVALRYE